MPLILHGGSILGLVRPVWMAGIVWHSFWFDAGSPTPAPRIVSPATSDQVAVSDAIYRRDTGPATVTDYVWTYSIAHGRPGNETITRQTSNAAVIEPDPADVSRWIYRGTGTATITLTCPTRTVQTQVSVGTGGAAITNTFLGYAPTCLRKIITDTDDGRLVGKTPATALGIFATQNHAQSIYVRNTACWAYGVDLTPLSPWNSSGGQNEAGILISPRHILFAAHYQIPVGATVRFITTNNQVVDRTMTAKATHPQYAPYYPDITVGVLDSDVPASISFARVLPDDWATHIPGSIVGIPALVLDQEEKALVDELSSIGTMVSFRAPADFLRRSFYEDIVGGDSGNPASLIIDNKLVLLNVWTFGGAGSGTSVAYHRAAINALMTSLGGGYQLTDADLSAYPSY
ncbi:MAG: hypothetical protein WC378_13935 [Opitutaceae bacterium]|jgi:hypothetical protein